MSNLVPFQFNSQTVRVIMMNDGEILYVAKDVATVLGYTNPQKAIRDHCKYAKSLIDIDRTIRSPHENQQLDLQAKVIQESDVNRLIMRSKLPSAEAFQDWLVEEVIPSIRRTGSYSTPIENKKHKPSLISPSKEFKAAMSIAKLIGLKGNQASIAANYAVRNITGVDVLDDLGHVHLVAENQERHFTPTELGREKGISAVIFNKMLEACNLQTKDPHSNWVPTELGKKFAVLLDTGKKHSCGTPIQQLKWLHSVSAAVTN